MASTWGQSWGTSWGAAWDAELVEVPSVVGETEASATSSLEGDGFVVAVETAYSNVVEAGLVISQVPAGGAFAGSGSTVVITVSLGPKADGAGKSRRKRPLLVEIDGELIPVQSIFEAQSLLEREKARAEQREPEVVARIAKRVKRGKKAPEPAISTPSEELKPLVSTYRADIDAIYKQIAVDAEIRALIGRKMAAEDEEDAITVLLLH